MATIDLTDANFAEKIGGQGISLVYFWASWCAPCRMFDPTYDRASEANPDIVFGKLDTEAQPALAAQFNIRSIPSLMLVRDGVAPNFGTDIPARRSATAETSAGVK